MPQAGGKLNRPEVADVDITNGLLALTDKLTYRLNQKGSATYASKHEILGILEEEMTELKEAIRIDTPTGYKDFSKELLDVAVGALFGYICIAAGHVAPSSWELEKEDKKAIFTLTEEVSCG